MSQANPSPADSAWPPVTVVIAGPTGAGKSQVAVALARALGGEVINADAFQVYRGMDIGTAKLPLEERQDVPHHLLDVLDVTAPMDAATFQAMSRSVLSELAQRHRPAIVVGGSWLYIRGALDDLRFPGTDPAIRLAYSDQLAAYGPQRLHELLARRDPAAAALILPTNGRRIVRALEVGELTGRPFQAELPRAGPPLVPHISLGVDIDQAELDARIEARVRHMLAAGWLAETSRLVGEGLESSPTAGRALGYGILIDHLNGRTSLPDAIEQIVVETRRFARRQRRWFQRDHRTHWFDPRSPSTVLGMLELIRSRSA